MNIARVGAVAGFAALALLANPALSSATVEGTTFTYRHFHETYDIITVDFSGISSPTLKGCSVLVVDALGRESFRGDVELTGTPGSGTYTSPPLNKGWGYRVFPRCTDADGESSLPAPDNPKQDLGGSVESGAGSLLSIFAS
jgi:hypothetical protein